MESPVVLLLRGLAVMVTLFAFESQLEKSEGRNLGAAVVVVVVDVVVEVGDNA